MTDFQFSTIAEQRRHYLDAKGLKCPEPVMLLHNKIRQMAAGDVVELCATDPSTERDILRFCDFLQHKLLHWQQCDQQYTFWIEKRNKEAQAP